MGVGAICARVATTVVLRHSESGQRRCNVLPTGAAAVSLRVGLGLRRAGAARCAQQRGLAW
eukprot:730718-Alexandrium_andersonii.AAC.1